MKRVVAAIVALGISSVTRQGLAAGEEVPPAETAPAAPGVAPGLVPAPEAAPPPAAAPVPAPVAPAPAMFAAYPPISTQAAPEPFGRAGQVIITQSFGFVSRGEETTTVSLHPAFNFLVTDVLTLGFELDYNRRSSKTSTSNEAGAGLLLGVVAKLSDGVSLWPSVGGGVLHDFDGDGSSQVLAVGQLALLFHPARHFFIGLTPEVSGVRSLEGSDQSFHFSKSLGSMIGGWW